MTVEIVTSVCATVTSAAIVGVWKLVSSSVKAATRSRAEQLEQLTKIGATLATLTGHIGQAHQPPGLLWDVRQIADQVLEHHEWLVRGGLDRRSGTDRRQGEGAIDA